MSSKSTNSKNSSSIKSMIQDPGASNGNAEMPQDSSQRLVEQQNYNEIIHDLASKKINYRPHNDDLWIYPRTLKKIKGCNLLIPGTRCPALKNFMGIKLKDDKIYMVESSNRISFPSSYKLSLVRFCNYLNLTNPSCHFYVMDVKIKEENRLIISSNRLIHLSLKEKLTNDFIEEIVTIDKIYQTVLSENLYLFVFHEFYFKPIFIKDKLSNLEKTKEVLIKSIKGMGFTQDKKIEAVSFHGKYFTITLAVNIDFRNGENQIENNFDWRILPIMIEIYDHLVIIKIRFCKNKNVVKIENELTQNLFAEFINYANLNLKKARYRFSYVNLNLTFESSIVTASLDFTQIQYSFQETFSYMIDNFKKYGSCFAKIYHETANCNASNCKFGQEELRDMYRALKQCNHLEETVNYSLFYMLSIHKNQVELLIPERFEEKLYSDQEFNLEVKILSELIERLPECYHIKIDKVKKSIFYPLYEEGQTVSETHTPGGKFVTIYQEFISRLINLGFQIKNPMSCISLVKIRGGYFAYFSSFPLQDFVVKVEKPNLLELRVHLKDLTDHIINDNQTGIKEEVILDYIEKEAFDEDFDLATSFEASLIGNKVTLKEAADISMIKEVQKKQIRNLPNTIGYIGLYRENNKHYFICEKLNKLNISSLNTRDVRKILNEIIHTIMLYKSTSEEVLLITENDLYQNLNGRLKIDIKNYDQNHLWNCFNPSKTHSQRQVYTLALLVYKLCCKIDPFSKFESISEGSLREQLRSGCRIPIFDWDFEQNNPKLVDFLRKCWFGDIDRIEKMRDCFPIEHI